VAPGPRDTTSTLGRRPPEEPLPQGRYFLLTGQTLNAQKALELGLVAGVLPPDKLLARAWELAEDLSQRPTLLLRYTRLLLTEALRRQMHDLLGYRLGMELLALGETPEAPAEAGSLTGSRP
jgi:enoyl-CoA hydratase/carnithine racemase